MLTYMYITNNPEVALIAEKNNVQRIWIDLERIGKEERQHNMDTVKSFHAIDDIRKIVPLLSSSEIMVRINPWNKGSEKEIEEVICAGAKIVMLPMWKTEEEVVCFLRTVNGRAKTNLLLETKEAVSILDDILEIQGIDEIHIGLNDLHLSYGLSFMFELLVNGTVENICKKIRNKEIIYGFGGIARLGNGALPAELIMKEHYRLGSQMAILSRSFCDTNIIKDINEVEFVFEKNMKLLREYEKEVAMLSESALIENQKKVAECVNAIVRKIHNDAEPA